MKFLWSSQLTNPFWNAGANAITVTVAMASGTSQRNTPVWPGTVAGGVEARGERVASVRALPSDSLRESTLRISFLADRPFGMNAPKRGLRRHNRVRTRPNQTGSNGARAEGTHGRFKDALPSAPDSVRPPPSTAF